jgi:hypothetical protein
LENESYGNYIAMNRTKRQTYQLIDLQKRIDPNAFWGPVVCLIFETKHVQSWQTQAGLSGKIDQKNLPPLFYFYYNQIYRSRMLAIYAQSNKHIK